MKNWLNKIYELNLLKNSSLQGSKIFSLDGKEKFCKVVAVYDGDTITVNMFIFGKIRQFKIRMLGYDTPEIRNKNLEEKQRGLAARDYLSDLILEKIVFVKCRGFDKYGRLLGTVYFEDICVNELMISESYGIPYFC